MISYYVEICRKGSGQMNQTIEEKTIEGPQEILVEIADKKDKEICQPAKSRINKKFKVVVVLLSLLIAGFITLCVIIFILFNSNLHKESKMEVNLQNEVISPVLNHRQNMIYLYDGSLGEIRIPVLSDVPPNTYITEYIDDIDGFKHYKSESGDIISNVGVDVSYHQGDIDWEKVKASGVHFAFIRLGYRGYETGDIVIDDTFVDNIEGATEAGIEVGVYFFSQATTVDEAIEEAEFVVSNLEGYDVSYPVVFDWENIGTDAARTDEVPAETLTDCTVAFCEYIDGAGYHPMIYSNKRTFILKLDMSRLKQYDFWLAEFNDLPSFYYDYKIWQYSYTGKVDGIEGDVDLNLAFHDYAGDR